MSRPPVIWLARHGEKQDEAGPFNWNLKLTVAGRNHIEGQARRLALEPVK